MRAGLAGMESTGGVTAVRLLYAAAGRPQLDDFVTRLPTVCALGQHGREGWGRVELIGESAR